MKDKKLKSENGKKMMTEMSTVANKGMPEDAYEMVNFYGTYEIQATAETDNQYPAIAQGYNQAIQTRDGENKHHGHKSRADDGETQKKACNKTLKGNN